MPYTIIPIQDKNGKDKAQSSTKVRCYQVRNAETGRITANCTSKEKAEKQVRLLKGLDSHTLRETQPPKTKPKLKVM